MRRIKLSRLYWIIVLSLCASGGEGMSLCTRISMERGVVELESLCDLEFCTCHNPFGKVRCVCPGENPDEELVLKSKGSCSIPPGTTSIYVDGCKKVTVIQDAFEGLRDLQNVDLVNIKEVSVESHVFHSSGPPRNLNFTNSTIPDVPSFTFTGNINSVTFDNCYVGVIRAFAFSSIEGADRIVFRDTNVANVESQSFKKFTMNKFLIIDSQFNVIPSRFVVDVVVDTLFKMDSTFVDEVRTLAFKIYSPKKVILVNSMINKLYAEAFKIVTRGEIVMHSNVFNSIQNEAFRGITVEKVVIQQSGKPKLNFQNQTVTNLEDKSLYFNRSNFEVQISRLMIDEACTCDGLMLWKDMITYGKGPSESIDSELEPIWCHMDDKKEGNYDYVSGREFYKEHCTKLTSSIYFFVIIISTTAVSLLITIIAIVFIVRHHRRWKPVPTSARDADRSLQERKKVGKRLQSQEIIKPETTKAAMIVPDGRTYKETEFHIIVEKAEPLDDECVPCTIVRDRSRSQIN